MSRPTVLMIGTFDTKGEEYQFLYDLLKKSEVNVLAVNVGVLGASELFPVSVEAEEVALAGGLSLATLQEGKDRGKAISTMCQGIVTIVQSLFKENRFQAVIGMGGSGGTGIVTSAMRSLPIGLPKVCISTLASGDISAFVGEKDIVMIPSVADIAGINRITRSILAQAAGAIVGMVNMEVSQEENGQRTIAASMFGNTTHCVNECRRILKEQGIETLVFHATGSGGRIMESLISDKLVDGVLDVTTTEWADELCGGILSAGSDRLSAAGEVGLPHLVVPGCIDMCNFGGMETVPEKYRKGDRLFYEWSPEITLMRTNTDENRQLGKIFAEKANQASGPIAFLIPTKGFSMLDSEGERFWNPDADRAFTDSLKEALLPEIRVVEVDLNINDDEFAVQAVEMLQDLMAKS